MFRGKIPLNKISEFLSQQLYLFVQPLLWQPMFMLLLPPSTLCSLNNKACSFFSTLFKSNDSTRISFYQMMFS